MANLVLYTFPDNWEGIMAHILAQYRRIELQVVTVIDPSLRPDPYTTVLVSGTCGDGDVEHFSGIDIVYELARGELGATDKEVMSWVRMAYSIIIPAAKAWVLPTPQNNLFNTQAIDDASNRVFDVFAQLNDCLEDGRLFLRCGRVTLADIGVVCSLMSLLKKVEPGLIPQRVQDWLKRCFNQQAFKQVLVYPAPLLVANVDARYFIPANVSFRRLDAPDLTSRRLKEKMYLHYLSRAAWYSGLVVLLQTSPESVEIFILLHKLFSFQPPEELRCLAHAVDMTDDEYNAFLLYAAGLFSNMGNYNSFGNTKFIPDVRKDTLQRLVYNSTAYANDNKTMADLWERCAPHMYSITKDVQQLGINGKGVTTFFSRNCDSGDIKRAEKRLNDRNLDGSNNRLIKATKDNGTINYEWRLASIDKNAPDSKVHGAKKVLTDSAGAKKRGPAGTKRNPSIDFSDLVDQMNLGTEDSELSNLMPQGLRPASSSQDSPTGLRPASSSQDSQTGGHPSYTYTFRGGDYANLMIQVCTNLQKAQGFTDDDKKQKMLDSHITFYRDGSRKACSDGKSQMIMNASDIECYFGFPTATNFRGRPFFGGVVAVEDLSMTGVCQQLKRNKKKLQGKLPWNHYEGVSPPNYASLSLVTFSGREMPCSFSTPYCYVGSTEELGKKTLSFENLMKASYSNLQSDDLTFLPESDKEMYKKWLPKARKMHLFLHEDLGHDNGKQFKVAEIDAGNSFSVNDTWYDFVGLGYLDDETFKKRFLDVGDALAYEECIAELVGLYLCLDEDVTCFFGHRGKEAQEVAYVVWLNVIRAALRGLEMYDELGNWTQIHARASFVILRRLVDQGVVNVVVEKNGDQRDLKIKTSLEQIFTKGKKAIEPLLQELQVSWSTSSSGGVDRFNELSMVDGNYSEFRDVVLKKRRVPMMYVQCHTEVEGGQLKLRSYEPTVEGFIQSFVDLFKGDNLEDLFMLEQHREDQQHW